LTNYKKDLETAGKLDKIISKKTRRPVYVIPEKVKPEIELLMNKQEITEGISRMTPQEVRELTEKLKETEKMLNAALSLLRQRKIGDVLDEGRERIDLRELDVEKDVEREIKRPKVSDVDLFDIDKKLWRQFLQEKHPDIWELVKEGKRPQKLPKNILEEYQGYRKKVLSADLAVGN
jgi:hypothetical protein